MMEKGKRTWHVTSGPLAWVPGDGEWRTDSVARREHWKDDKCAGVH